MVDQITKFHIVDGEFTLDVSNISDKLSSALKRLNRNSTGDEDGQVVLDQNDFQGSRSEFLQGVAQAFVDANYLVYSEKQSFIQFFDVYHEVKAFHQIVERWQEHALFVPENQAVCEPKKLVLDSDYVDHESDQWLLGDMENGLARRIEDILKTFSMPEPRSDSPLFRPERGSSKGQNFVFRQLLRKHLLATPLKTIKDYYTEAADFLSHYGALVYTCHDCPVIPVQLNPPPKLKQEESLQLSLVTILHFNLSK